MVGQHLITSQVSLCTSEGGATVCVTSGCLVIRSTCQFTNRAIYCAVNTFKKYHSKLKIGQLFKFKAYCDLHISKVSLYDKLNKALHQYGNHMNHQIFLRNLHEHNNNTWYYDGYDDFQDVFPQTRKRLSNLKDYSQNWTLSSSSWYVEYWQIVTNSYPSQKTINVVRKGSSWCYHENSQFVPLYTELYHYYETHSVSFTNTEDYLIIQIPIFFVNKKKALIDLYKLHTVHVHLNKDTYDGKESKYTRLDLK